MASTIFLLTACFVTIVNCGIIDDSASEEEILPLLESTLFARTLSTPASTPPPVLMCKACNCPQSPDAGSNVIDCKNQALTAIPSWNDNSLNYTIANLQLNFDGNLLTSVAVFPKILLLQVISIRMNNISKVEPFSFAELPVLKTLTLAMNNVRKLHKNAFAGLNDNDLPLERLDLSHNFLRTLDSDLFDHLASLQELNLGNNAFNHIDGSTASSLNSLHTLTTLSLAWNNLRTLPETLSNPVAHLTTFNLTGNNFTEIPAVLHLAKLLENLVLNSNPFRVFKEGDFTGMEQIKVLEISLMSNLTAIHKGTFATMHHIKILNCTFNPKLSYISPEAFLEDKEELIHDLQLYLNNNNLTTLSKKLLPWIAVEWLDLQDNPLTCDCHIRWIKERMPVKGNRELEPRLKCASPEEVKNQLLMDVNDTIFQKCQKLAAPPPNLSSLTNEEEHSTANTLGISLLLGAILAIGIIGTLFIVGYIVRRRRQLALAPKPRVRYVKARVSDADATDDIGLA